MEMIVKTGLLQGTPVILPFYCHCTASTILRNTSRSKLPHLQVLTFSCTTALVIINTSLLEASTLSLTIQILWFITHMINYPAVKGSGNEASHYRITYINFLQVRAYLSPISGLGVIDLIMKALLRVTGTTISTEESILHSDNRNLTTSANISQTPDAQSVLSPDVIPDYALYLVEY